MTKADWMLAKVYTKLNLNNKDDKAKYAQVNKIVEALGSMNRKTKVSAKTTGTISERLCELALRTSVPKAYKRISDSWNWMADFSVLGHPFNLLISVKSFKAKERLLVSGSGNSLSPTVGWGLFNDPNEWTPDRTQIYLFRSFIAVYLPAELYKKIPKRSKGIRNINGKAFLRKIDNLTIDLLKATNNEVIDITKF